MRKRDKLYKRWSRSGRPYDHSKFLDYKHLVRQVSDKAYGKYLGDILGINIEISDQDVGGHPVVKTKKALLPAQALQTGLKWHCSLIVGEPEIQKLEKRVAGKQQNFRLYTQSVWCIRSVKTDIAQILSLAKDVYFWSTHSYPHAGFM